MQTTSNTKPLATIVYTARDRFSMSVRVLNTLIEKTDGPYELICVDAGSPKVVAKDLARICAENGFKYLRFDRFMSPPEQRNTGLREASTKYIVFVENDVMVSDNWFSALIKCAEETDAEAIQPLICQGVPLHKEIHQAGGKFTDDLDGFFNGPPNERQFIDEHFHQGELVEDVKLERTETQITEVHCFLVRRDFFEKHGEFEERMPSSKDHMNFSMEVWKNGGKILLEPESIVTFCVPNRFHPVAPMDRPYFLLRWSNAWRLQSLRFMQDKWELGHAPYFQTYPGINPWRMVDGIIKPTARKLPYVGHSWKVQQMCKSVSVPALNVVSNMMARKHARQSKTATAK